MNNQKRSTGFFNGITGSLTPLNTRIIQNYSRLRPLLFFLPLVLLVAVALFLYIQGALSVNGYTHIQKDYFLLMNHQLGQYPGLESNLTQLGDALIFLSFVSIFILYAPKIWEALIPALLVSLLFSSTLKPFFAVPRPAVVYDNQSFFIIGKKLTGSNSLPSGHSITVFTVLTVLLFAFAPKKMSYRILWFFFAGATGLFLAFARVGVGAHYPLDVITGSTIGYISGLAGIFICQRYKIFSWVGNKKSYPLFMLVFLAGAIALINKIINDNLAIFYLSLVCLVLSLYKIIQVYAKKQSEVSTVL
ncbi:phosphatase PAP2 family protein [Niabella sp.]|uniref:phosphatase PAP2 family protein n=1 Tax=Niabella sp. TaxID=1962976 RepID=UPI00263964C8|nr:phosphatase PAP2 family protein [Niabella sp.]